jgi:simple sugar transport system ATP-binding protein
MQDSPLMKMVNISKRFGKVQALKDVSAIVQHNEILGLLGDNGAGKSTLIKVLSGVFPPDEGELYFEGKRVNFSSPRQARRMGIETVHQTLSLIGIMSISRNFFLGREPITWRRPIAILDRRKMDKECKKAVGGIGVKVRSPDESVSILSGGERQAVSIGRAMYFGAKLLLLDEPLASLSVREIKVVHEQIKRANESGASAIYITHNVYHVYPIAHRFVILDRGIKIAEIEKKDMKPEDIIEVIASGKMDSS